MAKKDAPLTKHTYQQALEELQELLKKLQSEELDIDRMVCEVKQACHLIKLCKEKLHTIEKEVGTMMDCIDEA